MSAHVDAYNRVLSAPPTCFSQCPSNGNFGQLIFPMWFYRSPKQT